MRPALLLLLAIPVAAQTPTLHTRTDTAPVKVYFANAHKPCEVPLGDLVLKAEYTAAFHLFSKEHYFVDVNAVAEAKAIATPPGLEMHVAYPLPVDMPCPRITFQNNTVLFNSVR